MKRRDWSGQRKTKIYPLKMSYNTDETTVQLEMDRQTWCYKRTEAEIQAQAQAQALVKVHVWAGISYRGHTTLCIFEGKMNAPLFISTLKKSLVPFIRDVYPDGHRFVQDNDPKHCSKHAQKCYAQQGINWWPTPPESPDLNSIENLWHELKEHIRRVHPRSKQMSSPKIASLANFTASTPILLSVWSELNFCKVSAIVWASLWESTWLTFCCTSCLMEQWGALCPMGDSFT